MQKTATVIALVAVAGLLGCRRRSGSPQAPQAKPKPKQLVDDPVAAVKAALPQGWIVLKVEENTHPPYRPKAGGRAIFLRIAGRKYPKIGYEAALYIMPPDYQDGGEDPTDGKAMTWSARLIGSTEHAKLYLWSQDRGPPWSSMREDLLKALVK